MTICRETRYVVTAMFLLLSSGRSQEMEFVTRSKDTLKIGAKPFYFLGANAYYLLERAARGDTTTVRDCFVTARALGMTVIRTWGFSDSADSLNPGVIQYAPGRYNEAALRGLDYVVACAKENQIRLLIPLVNNWDDYGGMNQYVSWRLQAGDNMPPERERYSSEDQSTFVEGSRGQRFRKALNQHFGHDDFYTDPTIREWYRNHLATILQRQNRRTGISYRDEPAILGWELANEPRSSERSGQTVGNWIEDISCYMKSLDAHHLVGTGEEGFDVGPGGYSTGAYGGQLWMFDGTDGVAFTSNSASGCIDFAGIHLYPESWNLAKATGNVWIRDHRWISAALEKPLIVGEFGVRGMQESTYDSWINTALLEDLGGALVWQLLEGSQQDEEEFGFRCPERLSLCSMLAGNAAQFNLKSLTGRLPLPLGYVLQQNYPNPFNGQTTVMYDLPFTARVNLSIYDLLGKHVTTVVDWVQSAGRRKELVSLELFATGTYIYALHVEPVLPVFQSFSSAGRMLLLK